MAYVDDLLKAHVEIKKNWQKLPIKQDAVIPPGVLIHCPLVGQQQVNASENCPTCPQFHGVGIMCESTDKTQQEELERTMAWSKRYCICCITIMELTGTGG